MDLILNQDLTKNTIFKIIDQDSYVKIKLTKLNRNDKNSIMLQIVNVSSEI